MNTALLITDGFEEAEAVVVCDILRRLDIGVELIACTDGDRLATEAYFRLSVTADKQLDEVMGATYDAVIVPGGPISTRALAANPRVINFIQYHDLSGRWLCALCSAPARVLRVNKLLKDRKYTCSGDLWQSCADGQYTGDDIVVDGNLITGKGLGMVFEFAFTIAEKIIGNAEKVQQLAEHIYFTRSNKVKII